MFWRRARRMRIASGMAYRIHLAKLSSILKNLSSFPNFTHLAVYHARRFRRCYR